MPNIQNRQKALLEIIGQESVFNQEELLVKLAKKGISTTQATLSRDLKALNIIKVTGQGYKVQQNTRPTPVSSVANGIMSIEFNGILAVIKTQVGFAPAVATYVDRHSIAPIMGTVAGDDTVLLILRQGYTTEQTLQALSVYFPRIWEQMITPE